MSLLVFLMLCMAWTGRALALGEEITVEYPSGTSLPDGGTVGFGILPVGSSVTRTITIHNTGIDYLTGLAVSKTGAHAADFTYSTPGAAILLPGGSTSFSITFSPSAGGSRTAIVRIASSDLNENPFDITVSGTGTAPEIAVSQAGTNLTSGVSTVKFGTVAMGNTASRTITIRNTGNGNLTGLALSLLAPNTFTVTALSTTTLTSSNSTSITVKFTPDSAIPSSGMLRISSNDGDENPFVIALTGTGSIPWLEVEQPPGQGLLNGYSTAVFPATPSGDTATLTFSIRNVGPAPLTGLALSVDGADPAAFSAGSLSAETLDAGSTLEFSVNFRPVSVAELTAVLHVSSNETFGNAFDVNLSGTGTPMEDAGDADRDGVPNLVELATGTDPFSPNQAPGSLVRNGDVLEFYFNRSIAMAAELSFVLEWSDTLTGSWNNTDGTSPYLLADDGTVQLIRLTVPAGTTGRRYVRLRVSRL